MHHKPPNLIAEKQPSATVSFILLLAIFIIVAFTISCSNDDDSSGDRISSCDINDYKTIEIFAGVSVGTQTWLAENFNCDVNGSKCYNNKQSNCDKYGRLYDWETALTICPSGWHLPSNEEWTAMMSSLYFLSPSGTTLAEALNTSGFSDGRMYDSSDFGGWWTSKYRSNAADCLIRRYDTEGIGMLLCDYTQLLSVRCIKD